VEANGLVATVDGRYPIVRSPAQFDGLRPELHRAPQHGEHTEEVLLELGRSWDDIAELKAAEAIS
jgi:crotonobetainyl-CoA:carnitine CoA-transferase CaiB-like acyl-CoA transferase